MDQSAFRQLVSSQSTGGRNTTEKQPKRVFGKSQKRTASNKDESGSSKFIPRKLTKGSKSAEEQDEEESERARLKKLYAENYTDRAAARRSGQEELNEFHDVEKLKEDFGKRLESARDESERQQLRQQMAFLGGDAKHTVLVNGLDFALLEQQRAKMNGDDDLGLAFSSQMKPEKASSTSNVPVKNDKFKPIGSSKAKEEESPEYTWRNGKRMRKKRKGKDATEHKLDEKSNAPIQPKRAKVPKTTKEESTTTTIQQSNKRSEDETSSLPLETDEKDVSGVKDTPTDPPSLTITKSVINQEEKAEHPPAEDSDEEDEDIFAGAGRWDGLTGDASDEDGAV